MGLFQAFDISASGMTAERFRMDTIAQNIANINTTRTEDGTRARAVGNGVKVTSVKEDDETEMRMVYDPSHPDADENGYVTYPNVNTVTEMTNLIDATRAYEANTTAFDATKSMVQAALNISK